MYTRKFIILKKELSTMGERNPKGHCKLEIRGTRGIVSVNIENAEEDHFYNVVFICDNNGASFTWELGKIFTDTMGRGRGEYVFTQRELDANNITLDKILGILITRCKDVLLGGYLDKEDGSIERYIDFDKQELKEVELNEPEEVMEVMEAMEAIEPAEPIEREDEIETIEITEVEEPIEELKEMEAFKIETMDIDEKLLDSAALDHIKKLNKKNQRTNYVLSILRFFPYIDPLVYNLKGHNWWKIELNSSSEYKEYLPYCKNMLGENNQKLIEKYGHYLFGLYNREGEVKYFIYGIPGAFIKEEKPEEIFHWHQGLYAEGYWFVYIDPLTGETIEHPIPMEPID